MVGVAFACGWLLVFSTTVHDREIGGEESEVFRLSGRVAEIREVLQVNKHFAKRDLVLDVPAQRKSLCLFQFGGAKMELLEGVKVGDLVTVSFGIHGHSWSNSDGTSGIFNILTAWGLEHYEEDSK